MEQQDTQKKARIKTRHVSSISEMVEARAKCAEDTAYNRGFAQGSRDGFRQGELAGRKKAMMNLYNAIRSRYQLLPVTSPRLGKIGNAYFRRMFKEWIKFICDTQPISRTPEQIEMLFEPCTSRYPDLIELEVDKNEKKTSNFIKLYQCSCCGREIPIGQRHTQVKLNEIKQNQT